jgi:hypothetical protein
VKLVDHSKTKFYTTKKDVKLGSEVVAYINPKNAYGRPVALVQEDMWKVAIRQDTMEMKGKLTKAKSSDVTTEGFPTQQAELFVGEIHFLPLQKRYPLNSRNSRNFS